MPDGDLSLVRPSSVSPARSSRKTVTTRRISSAAAGTSGSSSERPSSADPAGDDVDLFLGVGRHRQHDGVEPSPQRGGELVDAAVPVVRGGDEVEALARLDLVAELGHRQRLLGQDRDQRVLHVGRHPGQLLDPGDRAVGHRPEHRAGHERVAAGAVGEQARVVPAVADRLLGRAGGALDEQGGVAADRRGQMLGDPGLGRAGHAEQEQRPVGGEGGHSHLHQPPRADVLRRDGSPPAAVRPPSR